MSILQSAIEYLVPKGDFERIRSTAPDQRTYNIEATRDLVENMPLLASPFAPVGIAGISLPYDVVQGTKRASDKFFEANPTAFGIDDYGEVPVGPSLSDVAASIDAENPLSNVVERTQGATIGLANRLARSPEFLNNLFFTTAYAPEVTEDERKSIERQPSSFRSLSDPEDYEGPERDSLLSRILELGKGLGGGIVDAAKGAGSALSNLGIVGALRNLDQFKNLSQADQRFILQQAGGNVPGKDRFGYNIRSAFGNYASLVGNRADIAKERQAKGLPLRAIDLYYLNQEKERQKVLQEQIQESIDQGRSMQQSYEDSYSSMGYSSPAERAADTPTGTLGRV
mgnify:CR=1 FL=1